MPTIKINDEIIESRSWFYSMREQLLSCPQSFDQVMVDNVEIDIANIDQLCDIADLLDD
jgi:hypothetical protein